MDEKSFYFIFSYIALSIYLFILLLIEKNSKEWTKNVKRKKYWMFFTRYTVGPLLIISLPIILLTFIIGGELMVSFLDIQIWLVIICFFIIFISKNLTRKYVNNYIYELKTEGVSLNKGVFSINTTTIPYSKIEKCYISDDFFNRFFGLSSVDIVLKKETAWKKINKVVDTFSGGNSNPSYYYKYGNKNFFTIDGLTKQEAEIISKTINTKLSSTTIIESTSI